ncbi:hypothetical protein pEaSNUABM14_00117 [Erwinia phage pEa_SNUABM_14]|uniref:Uncharacterized protein n=1 Tax=Erwinia phage pEa_SNUABM_7 TaxID=2866695 RepID=A0AAE7WSC9_9CAUD|nr:hypothetical protein MPK74_gp118 [Erwinia phage pEa_SNUABM_7]QYW03077.1 hypothetical protein pEaSNUABM13_00118 [Erwinia phage pEa_SNUABM_13]QYW03418.1 hypothetical protein pEaSNUABM34_00116 [Erwinia phage pEa_SNUABM_34]QYW03760.1 hypothetical protein pEaSNUABM45_00117 [Erwinia phage pEa_SNUABM_45]QYW04101.1 hypothetical protein pEaSNUABM46_00117 [Erwinia phage pEa_SNUABM_46]QYW04442.1 hypothetical protein pEaSNUABM14_00117 [Erwinia phage pEa_SNUABM_14]QYW05131.1 hypothetical protein pEaSNU
MAADESIYVDALRLTPQGEQAVANANAGGIAVQPVSFKAGDYIGSNPSEVPEQLLGNELASGALSYVQVLSENSARFIFDIKLTYAAGEQLKRVGELMIMLKDNRPFGHVVLQEPIIAVPNSVSRVSLLIHLTQDVQKILAVEMADYTSIPSVATLENLPSLNDNVFNVVSVLDMHINSDGSKSPGQASRYGAGSYYWAFSEHDRVFSGQITSTGFINANTFKIPSLTSLKEGETVLVQTIAGTGAGACRHFKYTNQQLVNLDSAIPFVSAQTSIAVWRRITNPTTPSAGIPWPANNDVPSTWGLMRGADNEPYWGPVGGSRQTTASLFVPPGKMLFSSVVTTATPDALRYQLTEILDSSTDLFVGTSGVLQPRTAYSVQEDQLLLSSYPEQQMLLDLRQFRIEPSQGHVVLFELYEGVGDGQTTQFSLGSQVIESADMVFCVVGSTWQPSTVYKINNGNKITLTQAIPSGQKYSFYVARYEERANWSTRMRVSQYRLPYDADTYILPTSPLNKAHVVATMGGLTIHPSDFTVVGNSLQTVSPIPADTLVEITIFENVMAVGSKDSSVDGVIIDVIPTPTGFMFKRQGLSPIDVPMFVPEIIQGEGIKISGEWPNITISNTQALAEEADPKNMYNIHQDVEDSEELTITQRIEFKKGVMLTCVADFQCQLGPGFKATSGKEHIEYVLSYKTPGLAEAEYGRGLKGTGSSGFNVVDSTENLTEIIAYSNVSITQMLVVLAENQPQGFIDIVAKVRISNAQITSYGSKLIGNLCIKVEPK